MKKKLAFVGMICICLSLLFIACSNVGNEQNNDSVKTTTKTQNGESDFTTTTTKGSIKDPEKEEHDHTFGEWMTVKNATCTEKGVKERICACGEKETQSIEARNHLYGEWIIILEATHKETGLQARKCSCGAIEEKKIPVKDLGIFSIGTYNNGLARISTNLGYGYVDTKGNIVIDPIYEEASETFDTLVMVTENGVKKYINRESEDVYVFNGNEVKVGEYRNGFFWVETMEETISGNVHTMTYYDENGTEQFRIKNAKEAIDRVPAHNLDANNMIEVTHSSFNEYGYAVINNTAINKKQFINTKGEFVAVTGLNSDYSVKRLQNNFAIIDGSAVYIDYTDMSVLILGDGISDYYGYELSYKDLGDEYYASYDRFAYYKQYSGIYYDKKLIINFMKIDALGGAAVKDVIRITDNDMTYFAIYLESSSGVFFSAVIDEQGNIIMKPTNEFRIGHLSYNVYYLIPTYTFKDYECFNYGAGLLMAKDSESGLFGYVDLTGKWVIEPQYSEVTGFYGDGDDAVAVVDDIIIINRKGDVVFEG